MGKYMVFQLEYLMIQQLVYAIAGCLVFLIHKNHRKVYMTHKYNTQIRKLSGKGKIAFIEVIKGRENIWIGLGFNLYSLKEIKGKKKITEP